MHEIKEKQWLENELEELNWGGAKETIGDQRGALDYVLSQETRLWELYMLIPCLNLIGILNIVALCVNLF